LEELGAFEGAEGTVVFVFDLGAVAEEVFVHEVLGVVGVDVEHAEGEAFVRVGVGFGVLGVFESGGVVGFVEGGEPGAFGVGEALDEPLLLGEAFDEEGLGVALGLEVVEEGLLELVEFGLGFEGEDRGLGGESVLEGVEAGVLFAGFGFGSGGFGGVAAVGVDLLLGGHGSSIFRVAGST
jgi:hypothetical protein